MTTTTRSHGRQPEVVLILVGLALNGAWEALVTPLYADASRGWWYLLWTRAHCSAGDVLILLAAHAVTALVFRDRHWTGGSRHGAAVLFVTLGFGYTVWSEWFNARPGGSWEYADAMPTLLGIGVAPLAQWILVPVLLLVIARRCRP